MPSPVGHVLGGAAVYLAGTNKNADRSGVLLGVTLFGSILPDFDFLPGILIGNPAAFHHGVSHSFTFAFLFGALAFLFVRWHQKKLAVRATLLATLTYAFHLVLDLVNVTEGTRGIPIIWPLSDDQIGFNLHLFGHFHHGGLNQGIWGVLRWDNLPAIAREITFLGAPVLLLSFWREQRVRATLPQRP